MKHCFYVQIIKALVATIIFASTAYSSASNPIVKHIRTADPSAHVWKDGRVWIYTSKDMNDATSYDSMDGYHAFSSDDMINWTDHGEVLHSRDIPWGVSGLMWAPTAAFKNGKYYLIYPHSADGSRNMRCGVAVSDVPQGPFRDIGWIEGVAGQWLDPAVFTDSDETTYLYWGVYMPWVAKLKDNMKELAEDPRKVDYGGTNFFEASYMHKKLGTYYFSYSGFPGGYYSMGTNPYGPFQYKGAVNPEQQQDHHSMIDYKSQSYFFYHIRHWDGGNGHRRNIAVEYLHYNPDGTIQEIIPTVTGVDYHKIPGRIEAEHYSATKNFHTGITTDIGGGTFAGWSDIGDWLEYTIDVQKAGNYLVNYRVSSRAQPIIFNVKLANEIIGKLEAKPTGGWQTWQTVSHKLELPSGTHKLRIEAINSEWNINWIEFISVKK